MSILPLIMEIIFFRLIDFFYPKKYSSSRFILKVHRKLNSTRVSISFVIAISSLDDIILKNFPSDFQDRGSNQDLKKKKNSTARSSQFQDSLQPNDSEVILAKTPNSKQSVYHHRRINGSLLPPTVSPPNSTPLCTQKT